MAFSQDLKKEKKTTYIGHFDKTSDTKNETGEQKFKIYVKISPFNKISHLKCLFSCVKIFARKINSPALESM